MCTQRILSYIIEGGRLHTIRIEAQTIVDDINEQVFAHHKTTITIIIYLLLVNHFKVV